MYISQRRYPNEEDDTAAVPSASARLRMTAKESLRFPYLFSRELPCSFRFFFNRSNANVSLFLRQLRLFSFLLIVRIFLHFFFLCCICSIVFFVRRAPFLRRSRHHVHPRLAPNIIVFFESFTVEVIPEHVFRVPSKKIPHPLSFPRFFRHRLRRVLPKVVTQGHFLPCFSIHIRASKRFPGLIVRAVKSRVRVLLLSFLFFSRSLLGVSSSTTGTNISDISLPSFVELFETLSMCNEFVRLLLMSSRAVGKRTTTAALPKEKESVIVGKSSSPPLRPSPVFCFPSFQPHFEVVLVSCLPRLYSSSL